MRIQIYFLLLITGLYLSGSNSVEDQPLLFNLNKQVSRDLMIGPKEFIKPDPAKVDQAFLDMGQFIWGKDIGWDEKRQREFVIPPQQKKNVQDLRKEYLSNIDGYDMSFLSERFEECPCEDFGRQVGFISIRDLAEKKIADMIVAELKYSKFVRYVSLASGGYYFDYRVLRRVCTAWQALKVGNAVLEVFFVDPAAPYIPELEILLKRPEYTCKNLTLKLHTAAIPFEEFPKNLCPTIIGGIDMSFDFRTAVMQMCTSCRDKIKGVFLADTHPRDENLVLEFLTPVAKIDKKRVEKLKNDGYVEDLMGVTQDYVMLSKSIWFSEEGIKLFKQELKRAGLIN